MLELIYNHEEALVFDVEVWATLRKKHRILGVLIGDTSTTIQTLPLRLLPEEVLLLLDKKLGKLIKRDINTDSQLAANYENFEVELLAHEQIVFKENRKRQLESMIDDIVAAKRKRGDERSRDEILNEELEKSATVTKENMIWPILVKALEPGGSTPVSRDPIQRKTSLVKYEIYKDLWERGYYITSGHKFGADFLVYLGDPVAYHAIFIVHCVEDANKSIHPTEIVAFGRLATAVKKRAVLAYFTDKVSYITINWIDS